MPFNIKTEKILSPENCKRIISLGISLKDSISTLEDKCIEDYDSTKTYVKNSLVIYNGYIYKTKTVTTGDFDENKFEKIGDDLDLLTLDDIKALINLSDEEIASLQSLISTEIRLDKCFSSSDAYNRILNAENECKKFTLEQLAKKAGVVYKVVADTTGVDSTEFLYLISNGSNGYNIYAYIDGSAVKISDTNINLDDYAKLSDLDDFVKKTDADGKYALITTVSNHISDTVSHMTQSEKDSYALKNNITDLINASSTSEQMASAKGVYDNLINIFKDDVGLHTVVVKANEDLNNIINNTFLSVGAGALNSPYNTANFFGISTIFYNNPLYSSQILLDANENETTTHNRTIWIRHQFNGNWTNWFHITPTKTSDMAVTTLNSESSNFNFNNADSHFEYCVHNGTCFVNVWSIKCTIAGAELVLSTKLPAGIVNCVHPIHTNNSSTEYTIVGQLYTNGNILKVNAPQIFERGYCSFSYPVI